MRLLNQFFQLFGRQIQPPIVVEIKTGEFFPRFGVKGMRFEVLHVIACQLLGSFVG